MLEHAQEAIQLVEGRSRTDLDENAVNSSMRAGAMGKLEYGRG
jgi:hypothetical protein